MFFFFNQVIFRFHVNFEECICFRFVDVFNSVNSSVIFILRPCSYVLVDYTTNNIDDEFGG